MCGGVFMSLSRSWGGGGAGSFQVPETLGIFSWSLFQKSCLGCLGVSTNLVSVIIAPALVLWDRNWDQSKRIVKDNDQDQDLSLTSICSQTNGWQTLVVVVKLFLLVGYTILIEIFFFWLGGWAKNFFVPIKPCLGGHTSRTFWSKSWFGWFPGLIRPKRTAILPYVVCPPPKKSGVSNAK